MVTRAPSTSKRKRPETAAEQKKHAKTSAGKVAASGRGHVCLIEKNVRLRGGDDHEAALRQVSIDLANAGYSQTRADGDMIFGNRTGHIEYDEQKNLNAKLDRLEVWCFHFLRYLFYSVPTTSFIFLFLLFSFTAQAHGIRNGVRRKDSACGKEVSCGQWRRSRRMDRRYF
jgi:hypothetical protein